MKFAFFGSDEFAVKVLDNLLQSGWRPDLVVSTPDRPKGRQLVLTPPPVAAWSREHGLPLIQPPRLNETPAELERGHFDLFIVASYGKIIPAAILSLPKVGAINIHPSLLPRYRGPSPLQTAILNGDTETGVTIMLMDEQMDHGPLLGRRSYPLGAHQSFPALRDALAELGAQLLIEILPAYLAGKLTPQVQDHSQATYTKKISKADGALALTDPAAVNYRKVLALNPNPGTYLEDGSLRLKVKSAHLIDGRFVPHRVVPPGRKEMDWESYLRGKR